MAERQTVHVVDDDESFRKAVTRLLEAAGYEVVSYRSAGEFALTARREARSGCLLLDLRMPGPSGLDLQDSLAENNNTLPIIFLTAHADVASTVRAMKRGAVDFLTKPVKRAELLNAVRTALARAARLHTSQQQRLELQRCVEKLTARERQVFELVVAGKLNKQIAADLGMAERTVKAHRAQVMEKMDADSLAELVHIADKIAAEPA